MTDCLFCKIASGEIPSKKAYSDERIYAFHDIAPKAPTHVLVIPRRHIGKLSDASREDEVLIGELVGRAATQKVASTSRRRSLRTLNPKVAGSIPARHIQVFAGIRRTLGSGRRKHGSGTAVCHHTAA